LDDQQEPTVAVLLLDGCESDARADRCPRTPPCRRDCCTNPGRGRWIVSNGNGGYDVRHYSLQLGYEPQNNALDARAVISARATQDLSRFDLDLRGLHVGQVTVGGDPAAFERDGQELVITPAAGIRSGRAFEVAVEYDGHPNPIIDPDKSKDGWIPTDDGAFVVNEPSLSLSDDEQERRSTVLLLDGCVPRSRCCASRCLRRCGRCLENGERAARVAVLGCRPSRS
jgi:hypothetical protein